MLTVDLIPPQSEAEERPSVPAHHAFRDFRFLEAGLGVYFRDEVSTWQQTTHFELRIRKMKDADALGIILRRNS